jgi:hypothetical protein
MTGSSKDSDLLDLERGMTSTPADALALRRVRASRRLSDEDFLRALARLPPVAPDARRSGKRVYGGEPFQLTDRD